MSGATTFAGPEVQAGDRLVRTARILGSTFLLGQLVIAVSLVVVIERVVTFGLCVGLAGIYQERLVAEHPELESESRAFVQDLSETLGIDFFRGADRHVVVGAYVAMRFMHGWERWVWYALGFGVGLFLVYAALRTRLVEAPEELAPQGAEDPRLKKVFEDISGLLPRGLIAVPGSAGTCCDRNKVYVCPGDLALCWRDIEAGSFVIRHEVFHYRSRDSVLRWANRVAANFVSFVLAGLVILLVGPWIPSLPVRHLELVPVLLLVPLGWALHRLFFIPYLCLAGYLELLADGYAGVGVDRMAGARAITPNRCSNPERENPSVPERLAYQASGTTARPLRLFSYLQLLWIATVCVPGALGSGFAAGMAFTAAPLSFPLLMEARKNPRQGTFEPASVLTVLAAIGIAFLIVTPYLWHRLGLMGASAPGLKAPEGGVLAYALYVVSSYGFTPRR